MATSTVSTKGQITLPASLREKLGIKPHDRVRMEGTEDAIVIRRAPDLLTFEGFLGKRLPESEEKQRVARFLAGRGRRSGK